MLLTVRPTAGAVIAIAAATAIAAWASCSQNGSVNAEADASGVFQKVDGGAPAVDGGRAVSDAGSAPDADAGFDPFVGTWAPLPGRPSGCSLRYAIDPAASIPQLKWAPCPSGRAGCRKVVVDWPRTPGRVFAFGRFEIVHLVNGQPYIVYGKYWPRGVFSMKEYEADMVIVARLDGAAVFALGSLERDTEPPCLGWAAAGDYGIGFYAITQASMSLGWAPWSSLGSWTSLTPPTGRPIELALSSSQMFLSLGPGVQFVHLADAGVVTSQTPTAFPGDATWVVADGAFSFDTTNINFLHNDGSWNVAVTPTSPQVVTYMGLDRSNSNTLVWVEADNGGAWEYWNPVLWRSPYATTVGGISKTKVAVIADANGYGLPNMAVNAGVALNVVGRSAALLTRLSDGAGWAIAAEPGDTFNAPLWVDDNKVWLSTSDAAFPNPRLYDLGIVRIARSSLGAPTVPRGF